MVDFSQWRNLSDGHPVYQDMVDAADYHWRIDEGSGSTITCNITGEEGTLQGATWVDDSQWVGGHGLDFDPSANSGDGAWVEFGIDSEAFGGSDYLWVSVSFLPRAVDTRGILASVVDPNDADRWNLESGSWDTNGSVAWWMSGDTSVTSDADSIVNGTKYHTVGIHDLEYEYRELMINGNSVGTATVNGEIPGGEPTPLKMGRRGPGGRTFDGVIGEVMIGQTHLTDEDKSRLYERQSL